jgi:hypothetical protein
MDTVCLDVNRLRPCFASLNVNQAVLLEVRQEFSDYLGIISEMIWRSS